MIIDLSLRSLFMANHCKNKVTSADCPNSAHISFDVSFRKIEDTLELETGEIFSREKYENGISAQLDVVLAEKKEKLQQSRMIYHESVDHWRSSISFQVFVDPITFSDLKENIRHKIYPSSIVLHLEWSPNSRSALRYGSNPNGNQKKWLNKDELSRHVPIEMIGFGYEIIPLQK